MEKVRVGIIGAGWVATNRQLPALSELPEVSLELIWSRSPDKAQEVAQQFQVARVAQRWEEVCDSSDVDAVVVATPPVLQLRSERQGAESREARSLPGPDGSQSERGSGHDRGSAVFGTCSGTVPSAPGS